MKYMMSDEIITSVAVVGAGPAGLVAAATLAHYGIDVVLLEKRSQGSDLPRASVASVRTMELMRSFGLAERVLAGADDVAFTLLRMRTAAKAADGAEVEVGYPSVGEAAMISPTRAASVAQDHLERVLSEHVEALPGAAVLRGVEVTQVLHDGRTGDGVRLLGRMAGRDLRIRAEYAIAADGAWSRVRRSLGVEMLGPQELFRLVQAEVRAPLWEVLGPHRHLVYTVTHPKAEGVLVPAGLGDRWIYIVVLDAEEPEPDAAEMAERLRIAAGVDDLPIQVQRLNRANPGAQVASRFSSGHVYLTGDAAHRVTPRGGTGLNTAVGSAHNLAWKLAWVSRGWSDATLLRSYESERRPVAEHNVRRSADAGRAPAAVLGETLIDLGGRMRHVWLTSTPSPHSTLDELGPGLSIFIGYQGGDWVGAVRRWHERHRLPLRPVHLNPSDTISLGLAPAGALLVGPDGGPIAQWTEVGAADFEAAMPWATQRTQVDAHPLARTA